jgi:hypothetical protein
MFTLHVSGVYDISLFIPEGISIEADSFRNKNKKPSSGVYDISLFIPEGISIGIKIKSHLQVCMIFHFLFLKE